MDIIIIVVVIFVVVVVICGIFFLSISRPNNLLSSLPITFNGTSGSDIFPSITRFTSPLSFSTIKKSFLLMKTMLVRNSNSATINSAFNSGTLMTIDPSDSF